jgi:hypothetical protein
MPKAKGGVRDGSQYLDIGALFGGEHVVRTTEVVGKRPVGRPKGSTKRMRSAEASTSAAAAADNIQEAGDQTSDEGDKDTVGAALKEKRAAVARVRQWFEGEPRDEELICIACSHNHKIPTKIKSVLDGLRKHVASDKHKKCAIAYDRWLMRGKCTPPCFDQCPQCPPRFHMWIFKVPWFPLQQLNIGARLPSSWRR